MTTTTANITELTADDIAALAKDIIPHSTHGGDEGWNEFARSVLAAALWHAKTSGGGMDEVTRLLSINPDPELKNCIISSPFNEDREGFRSIESHNRNTFLSACAVAYNHWRANALC